MMQQLQLNYGGIKHITKEANQSQAAQRAALGMFAVNLGVMCSI